MHYLVGTPKGRLSRFEEALLAKSWQETRPGVDVKLLPKDGELYVYAQSRDRVAKERAIRRRKLKRLWARLKQLSAMTLTSEALLMKLGAARAKAPSAWRLVEVKLAELRGRIGCDAPSAEPIQTPVFSAYPDIARPIFIDRVDRIARESFRSGEGREVTVFDPVETAAGGTDPQAPFAILIDSPHTAIGEPVFSRE